MVHYIFLITNWKTYKRRVLRNIHVVNESFGSYSYLELQEILMIFRVSQTTKKFSSSFSGSQPVSEKFYFLEKRFLPKQTGHY